MKRCLGLALLLFGACGDAPGSEDPNGRPVPVACDPAVDEEGQAYACISGRLVDEQGGPIANLAVGACSFDLCIKGDTDAEGRYAIQKLPLSTQKVEVFGMLQGYADMIYWQDFEPGFMSEAPQDIVVHRLDMPHAGWAAETGGTILLADGALELSAAPDSLLYPIGEEDEVTALEIAPSSLGPFDEHPWVGHEASTRAFLINPFPLTATEPVHVVIHGAVGVEKGARYGVYTADAVTGELVLAGEAEADGQGAIVMDDDAGIVDLTTLILVPR